MKREKAEKIGLFTHATNGVKNFFYDIYAWIVNRRRTKTGYKIQKASTKRRNDLIFYISCATIPMIFFVLGNFVINGNSLLMAFRSYDILTGKSNFAGFDNFKNVINSFINDSDLMTALERSALVYVVLVVVTTVIPIILSYYIYKKLPMHRIFKVIMFLPTIISGIITITVFKTIAERMIPSFMELVTGNEMEGLLSNPNTAFNTIMFYSMWLSMGGGLLVKLASMNTVDESVAESAKLEGIGFFQELWYIVLPASYQVISISFITSFATLFTNDIGLFAFYGLNAPAKVHTLGYHFTVKTLQSSVFDYPFYSAWGLITSAIAIPVTLTLRHVIYKYGPSED